MEGNENFGHDHGDVVGNQLWFFVAHRFADEVVGLNDVADFLFVPVDDDDSSFRIISIFIIIVFLIFEEFIQNLTRHLQVLTIFSLVVGNLF